MSSGKSALQRDVSDLTLDFAREQANARGEAGPTDEEAPQVTRPTT